MSDTEQPIPEELLEEVINAADRVVSHVTHEPYGIIRIFHEYPHVQPIEAALQLSDAIGTYVQAEIQKRRAVEARDIHGEAVACEAAALAARSVLEILTIARQRKDAWLAAARKSFLPSERRPCQVCHRWKAIVHAHHVIPLSSQYDRGFEQPNHDHIWLCPSHHAAVHLLIAPRQSSADQLEAAKRIVNDIDDNEYQRILQIIGYASGQP